MVIVGSESSDSVQVVTVERNIDYCSTKCCFRSKLSLSQVAVSTLAQTSKVYLVVPSHTINCYCLRQSFCDLFEKSTQTVTPICVQAEMPLVSISLLDR